VNTGNWDYKEDIFIPMSSAELKISLFNFFIITWKSINWQGTFEKTGAHPMGHNPSIWQETPILKVRF